MLLVALFIELEKALSWAEGESQEESEASKDGTVRMVEGILATLGELPLVLLLEAAVAGVAATAVLKPAAKDGVGSPGLVVL